MQTIHVRFLAFKLFSIIFYEFLAPRVIGFEFGLPPKQKGKIIETRKVDSSHCRFRFCRF